MAKQIFWLCLLCLLVLFTTTETLANTNWEISFEEWALTGLFNYTLYYPYSSQVISMVALPQDQLIKIINIKYYPANNNYIRIQYAEAEPSLRGKFGLGLDHQRLQYLNALWSDGCFR